MLDRMNTLKEIRNHFIELIQVVHLLKKQNRIFVIYFMVSFSIKEFTIIRCFLSRICISFNKSDFFSHCGPFGGAEKVHHIIIEFYENDIPARIRTGLKLLSEDPLVVALT